MTQRSHGQHVIVARKCHALLLHVMTLGTFYDQNCVQKYVMLVWHSSSRVDIVGANIQSGRM